MAYGSTRAKKYALERLDTIEPSPGSSPQRQDTSYPVATLEVWNNLPETIKLDPFLANFREGYEKHFRRCSNASLRGLSVPSTSRNSFCNPTDIPLTELRESTPLLGGNTMGKHYTAINLQLAQSTDRKRKGSLLPSVHGGADDDDVSDNPTETRTNTCAKYTKIIILLIVWITFTAILMTKSEKLNNMHQLSLPEGKTRSYWILEKPSKSELSVTLQGAFVPSVYANMSSHWVSVWVEHSEAHWTTHFNLSTIMEDEDLDRQKFFTQNVSDLWEIPIVPEGLVDFVPEIKAQKVFTLHEYEVDLPKSLLRLRLETNLGSSFPLAVSYDISPIDMDDGIVYAAIVLLGLYILIIFEIVNRTLAAILAATMSVAILAALNERPTMAELISWLDVETLLLLFSMMTLVAIFSETGIFDYLAVFAYKVTSGRVWPLITILCIFTAVLSAFLDNVTTVLLMTPVTIRLCEAMELNPVPILMSMVIFSNIGGTATAVGDPPNVIIASNKDIVDAGIDFSQFTLHMSFGVILVMIVNYFQLRFIYRNINDLRFAEPQDVRELRHEIAIWQRAAASLSSYSRDEDLVRETLLKKVRRLLSELKRKLMSGSLPEENYKANLEELQEKYPIRDRSLLYKSAATLVFVITVFFLHSIPQLNLSLGWTALLGAILLLILADRDDLEGVFARVEWTTLIFFAALFVLMESLAKLGLIEWIGKQTEMMISSVDKDSRLAVAILIILWISAIASAFVDNIPLTTMMVRIVTSLAKNPELDLPLQPLVWALAFGACLGGNGTLIGASANVVCAGVAEQHGYRFTFMQYFKVGFPVMIVSIITAMLYLMVAHVALGWNS